MDGLSSAASGIAVVSLTGQLAQGLVNLHSFWASIVDAPSDIRAISLDLKLFQDILQQIQENDQRYGVDTSTAAVLNHCFNQVQELAEITGKLEQGFQARSSPKRAWSSLKAVLKHDKIKKFQDQLNAAKSTLCLAQQSDYRSTYPVRLVIFYSC